MTLQNRYEINGSNSSGGMGDILYCKDNHLQRNVVIKLLKDNEEERRLIDEQKSLLNLRSKHVVQLYDIVRIDGKIGLVLEFIEGKDLSSESFKDDMNGLVSTLWQISCGLRDIHNEGIIHRDIKPNNIRRNRNGVIKVFDFGLSRKSDSAKTQSVIGTVVFMAPELWKLGEVEFTSAIDVYAFGVTALALTQVNVPEGLLKYPPQPVGLGWLQNTLPDLDPDIVSILERCLEYTPKDRPQIVEVEHAFRRHLLKDRHKGLLVMDQQVKELNCHNRRAKITYTVGNTLHGEIAIEYNGYDFNVIAFSGAVFVNNTAVTIGQKLPGASVITLGNGKKRGFVTFDISNPEVVS
ncbi:serine/threonine protein kinase [Rheinheimera muenzenbergensis]|uniref:Serine/threonine protein kinase n=1 Tax=Rheinheimera muenzenbergensis TaxID=1193628 RepID=A0ABU8C126_9GAMM